MKKATKRTTKRRAPKRAATKRKRTRKPLASNGLIASTFVRAVRAGDKAMARKLERETRRRSKFGPYDAHLFAGIGVNDLKAYEELTKPKRRG
jgi:hypothetical protein